MVTQEAPGIPCCSLTEALSCNKKRSHWPKLHRGSPAKTEVDFPSKTEWSPAGLREKTLLPQIETSSMKEVEWSPSQLESSNPTNASEEPLAPKVDKTSPVEPPTPQPERTHPRNSTGGLHHNSRGAHWTSHIERGHSAANKDEPTTTIREKLAH